MKKTVKIGYVGLGRRGFACLNECLIRMADVEVVTLCDTNPTSLEKAAAPIDFPDFTRGKWTDREPDPQGKYSLSEVIEDRSVKLYNEGDII